MKNIISKFKIPALRAGGRNSKFFLSPEGRKRQSLKRGFNPGFTLIEVLVTIFGFSLISVGLIALVSNLFTSSYQQSGLLADTDQARKIAFGIVGELRNAETSSTGAYSLDTAQAQQLIFYANVDGGPDVERVRYFTQSGKLYKGILKPTGSPLTYNPANEKTFVVQNNLANGSSPIFYYYDGSFDGTIDNYLTQPVNVTQVKLVKVELRIYNKAGVLNSNFYTVTASGTIRNLKTNLGE